MLIPILALVLFTTMRPASGPWTLKKLLNTPMSIWSACLMLGFLVSCAVKMPVVRCMAGSMALCQAPTASFINLAGILLKTAACTVSTLFPAAVPERVGRVQPIAMSAGCYRHLLRCVDGLRPDRYQTSDRLHLGFPHGLRADCYLHRQPVGLQER